jgi:peptidoglycan hydrolase-like protein with peptidoglycan-binding domain
VLAAIGYQLGVDGDFGPATESVVLSFQADVGLQPDGLFGRQSKQALEAAYAAVAPDDSRTISSILRRGSRGSEVETLQEELSREGFNPGTVDGLFGSRTERAVVDFQAARALAVDGVVGPQTLRALGLQ